MKLTCVALIFLLYVTVAQAFITIPTDYPTIMAGVDAASDQDTLILERGSYTEAIEINQPLTLASQYLLTGDSTDMLETILDGADSLSILKCLGGDTCHISGLVFQRGALHPSPYANLNWGAAVTVSDSGTLMLDHCRFQDPHSIYDNGYSQTLVSHDSCTISLSNCLFTDHVDLEGECISFWLPRTINLQHLVFREINCKPLISVGAFETNIEDILIEECNFSADMGVFRLIDVAGFEQTVRDIRVVNNTGTYKANLLFFYHAIPGGGGYADIQDILIDHNEFWNQDPGWMSTSLHIGIFSATVRNIQITNNRFYNRHESFFDNGAPALWVSTGDLTDAFVIIDSVLISDNYVEHMLGEAKHLAPIAVGCLKSDSTSYISNVRVLRNEYRRTDLEETEYATDPGAPGVSFAGMNVRVENLEVGWIQTDLAYRGMGIRIDYGSYYNASGIRKEMEFRNVYIHDLSWDYWDPNAFTGPNGAGIFGIADDNWHQGTCGIHKILFDNLTMERIEDGDFAIGFEWNNRDMADSVIFRNSRFGHIGNGLGFTAGKQFSMENVLFHDIYSYSTNTFYDLRYLFAVNYNSVDFISCTFADMDVPDMPYYPYWQGRIFQIYDDAERVSFKNCIIEKVAENSDVFIIDNPDSTDVEVSYSCVTGGWPGVGNIDAEPMFMDPDNDDYRLQPVSPCVDAGDPSADYNDPEDPNNPGWAAEPSQGSTRCDMGAFGGPDADILYEYLEDVSHSSPPHSDTEPEELQLFQNHPNPFNPRTFIEFELGRPMEVELTVYNLLGEQVAALEHGWMNAGRHQRSFDGATLASGIYIYRLEADGQVQSRKMLLVK